MRTHDNNREYMKTLEYNRIIFSEYVLYIGEHLQPFHSLPLHSRLLTADVALPDTLLSH